jgi:hypothetical protein
MTWKTMLAVCSIVEMMGAGPAHAGGGPLGIDSRLNEDNQGIWKRSNQKALEGIMIGGAIVGALWEGADSRMGKTF